MMALAWIVGGLTGLLSVPVCVLSLQVLAAWLPRQRVALARSVGLRVAVLVPAHNEASGIGVTLATILPQMQPQDTVLVVADNCSDDTASVARAVGAQVVEREDATLRGKGFALDFGMQALTQQAPDVLVIVDADCTVSKDGISRLVARAMATGRPVQALYLMRAPAKSGLRMRLAEFAWRVKNQVRPRGFASLGLPCPLMGTGMAFPWPVLAQVSLANGHLAEDMKLGIDLAAMGHAPLFEDQVQVDSLFPTQISAQSSQRTRWEHGHLGLMATQVPHLFWLGLRQMNREILAMALDIAVPPLALLAALLLVSLLVSVFLWVVSGFVWPWYLSLFNLALFGGSILLAWAGWGRETVSLSGLLYVPFYVLGKLPRYVTFVFKRQKNWVKTERDKH